MPGFDTSAISDRDLDDLIAYLYYMAKRKVDVPARSSRTRVASVAARVRRRGWHGHALE